MNLDTAQLQEVQNVPSKLFATIGNFNLPGGFVFSPNYLQAGLIVLCIFLLILTFGMLQHRFNHWTVKGILPGIGLGFLLAILLESILLISGRTVMTEVVGWKNAPKPISNALEASRGRLVEVLGVSTVPESNANEKPTIGGIMSQYENLSDNEQESLQSLVCPR